MVPIRQLLVVKGVRRSGKKLDSMEGVVIHNVDNLKVGANADANARYQYNSPNFRNPNGSTASWHSTVDGKEIVESIPLDEVAYHCGNKHGNNNTVGVEICDNQDGDILAATNNAAWYAAKILKGAGFTKAIWKENIWQHNDMSGKNCPSKIRAGIPYGWDQFVINVNNFMNPSVVVAPSGPQPTFHIDKYLEYIKGDRIIDAPGEDNVTAIQRNLKSLGYYKGKVDGDFGPMTKNAVEQFQEDYELEVDGVVGKQTTTELGGVWDGE